MTDPNDPYFTRPPADSFVGWILVVFTALFVLAAIIR